MVKKYLFAIGVLELFGALFLIVSFCIKIFSANYSIDFLSIVELILLFIVMPAFGVVCINVASLLEQSEQNNDYNVLLAKIKVLEKEQKAFINKETEKTNSEKNEPTPSKQELNTVLTEDTSSNVKSVPLINEEVRKDNKKNDDIGIDDEVSIVNDCKKDGIQLKKDEFGVVDNILFGSSGRMYVVIINGHSFSFKIEELVKKA